MAMLDILPRWVLSPEGCLEKEETVLKKKDKVHCVEFADCFYTTL